MKLNGGEYGRRKVMKTLEMMENELKEELQKYRTRDFKSRYEQDKKVDCLKDEINQYKIKNKLYSPMDELIKYKNKSLSRIVIVTKDDNGELNWMEIESSPDGSPEIDENGKVSYDSMMFHVNYDYEKNKYMGFGMSGYGHGVDFIGILDIVESHWTR